MSWLPLALALAGASVAVGLVTEVLHAARRRPTRAVPTWAFALLPLVAFTLQEFLERWLMVGGFPWWMVEQPTFRVGLLLQLPFALATFVVVRLLTRTAERIGLALVAPRPVLCATRGASYSPAAAGLRASVLSRGHAGRAPPARPRALLPCS